MNDYISLTAYWADGCGESEIEISLEEWEDILNGKKLGFESDSWYDGERLMSTGISMKKNLIFMKLRLIE